MPSLTASTPTPHHPVWKILAEISLPGQPGSVHLAQEQVAAVGQRMSLSLTTTERLKSAVTEAVLKAIEHSHHSPADLPLFIRVLVLEQATSADGFSQANEPTLNLQALKSKPSGEPSRRGWGFFLLHRLGKALPYPGEVYYILELFLYQEDD